MRTVLIAQPEEAFAYQLATELRAAGYRAITCPGPWPPALRCIRCDVGYCPLTEAADVLVYDPDLIGYDADGTRHPLAVESARAHPDAPMVLAWPGAEEPTSAAAIIAEVPGARRAVKQPGGLAEQVRQLVDSPRALAMAR